MSKVLAQAGISLADTYDIEGSIAGVEQLQAKDVSLVHEMGATIFSERLVQVVRRIATGDLLQTVSFDTSISDLPSTPTRVQGCIVTADADRVLNCGVFLRDPFDQREHPIFVWDSAVDDAINIRMRDDGAAAATRIFLRPSVLSGGIPNMLMGSEQRRGTQDVVFRVNTTTFGAGTVDVVAQVLIAFANVQGSVVSSYGLPIPSW